jgi:hypothetical protein
MKLDLDRVRRNVRKAATEDLLDRVTAFKDGIEPAALEIIAEELRSRGVDEQAIAAHAERRKECVCREDGTAIRCSFCHRPAVVQRRGWHRLWGVLPLFPRRLAYCEVHRPKVTSSSTTHRHPPA